MLPADFRKDQTLLPGDLVCTRDHTYRITEVRGLGGSGIIYAATRDDSPAQYVLKEFFPAGSFERRGVRVRCTYSPELHEEYAERFRKEGQLSALLHNHSRRIIRLELIHVTRILHKEKLYRGRAVSGCLFGLMDDLVGAGNFLASLWDGKHPMDVRLALNVTVQVLEALKTCHRNRYRHGDLSLGNIYFTEWNETTAGYGCLLDFTLSTHVDGEGFDDAPAVSRGTAPFMAPELNLQGLRGLHSDVWSAARLLLLLLNCSTRPLNPHREPIEEEDLPFIHCSEVLRPKLNRVLTAALEPDPLLRRETYPDADALLRDLKALLPYTEDPHYTINSRPLSTEGFRFREQELLKLQQALENRELPLVSGIAGCGKTSLCVRLGQRLKKHRTYVIPYVPSTEYDSMEETVLRIPLEPYVYEPARPDLPKAQQRRQEFRERLHILLNHFPNAYFIIDNLRHPSKPLEELLKEPCFETFVTLLPNPMVLTTRMMQPYDYPHLRLELKPLPEQELLELMRHHLRGTPVEEGLLRELIRETGGHTLTLILVASTLHAREGLADPGAILTQLRQSHLSELPLADRQDGRLFSYLRTLFDFSALDSDQRSVLRLLLQFGEEGTDYHLFCKGLDQSQLWALRRLEQTGWIRRAVTYGRRLPAQLKTEHNRRASTPLQLHPMIWDVCVEELQNDPCAPNFPPNGKTD